MLTLSIPHLLGVLIGVIVITLLASGKMEDFLK